ncbi:MAG: hypothetical protein PF489_12425 [Salinivirgaceae bacterium]|jgi:hypothetical protein|nr:hypothetical protein [Salinivirgaceae bacterium]
MKTKIFSIILLIVSVQFAKANSIGEWDFASNGLPTYHYTGVLPFPSLDKDGKNNMLPEDPFFLLGNYRMALITHTSGIYQFLTAERAWARINATEKPNYGWNDASIVFKNKKAQKVNLVGLQSIATNNELVKKTFGVGFARYAYRLENGISCTRLISVKPSAKINTGNPSFVVTILLQNNSKKTQELIYSERMLVNFVLNGTQYKQSTERPVLYNSNIRINADKQIAIANISYKTNTFLNLPSKDERYMYDLNPPSVFMLAKNGMGKDVSLVSAINDTLSTQIDVSLKPGETKTFHVVIGLADGENFTDVQKQADELFAAANINEPLEGLYAGLWKSRLPDLSSEKNVVLRREMLWNAHMIEASAKDSEYYKETFIPQGTVYSYHFGDNISNRDHLQAALPACYTNPELAKSCIRYVIKHSEVDGEIKRGNSGFGYTPPSLFKESDEQLFFFNTLSEYLLITKDFGFLNEQVTYFPAEYGKTDAVLNILKKYFIYLRDEVGRGPNGLVKILNSDWSDSFFHKYSPNAYSWSAESHLNSAMVLSIFPKLEDALKQSKNPDASEFIQALEEYRISIESAFMKDLGDRKFAARAYLNHKLKFGVDKVCIEPQGYLLQIPNLPIERKKEIYEYVKSKLITPEKIGIRTREEPRWGGTADGEDGGIWFSLEYPVLLGVATFDKEEAKSLLLKFSFDNYSKHYPDYWIGQWTAPDEMNSTLYREGLYCFWIPENERASAFQGYCSHPHTWPLFCYFKLME